MAAVGFSSIVELSDLIVTQFQVRFEDAINAAAQLGQTLSTEFVTNTDAMNVPFVDKWTTLTGYELNEMPSYKTIVGETLNRKIYKYAKGIEISKFTWNDPAAQSILQSQLNALVAEAAWLRTRRIARALNLGDTSAYPVYDGQNLFSNSHTINGFSFDNLLAGNVLDPDGFNAAKTVLQSVPLGDDGTYLPTELATFHLIVPPALEKDARLVLRSTTIYESNIVADNPFLNAAQLHVTSLLTDANDWYLGMTLPGLTPFATVKHVTSDAALIPRVAETDPNVIEKNMYLWNLQLAEETYPIHFYQLVKCTNS